MVAVAVVVVVLVHAYLRLQLKFAAIIIGKQLNRRSVRRQKEVPAAEEEKSVCIGIQHETTVDDYEDDDDRGKTDGNNVFDVDEEEKNG